MKMLRKYIQKCVEEIFVDEETSSSNKQDGVTTDQSTWDAEFKASAPDSGFPKTDKTMWDAEFNKSASNSNAQASAK
jgi:hypothetical protein